MLFVALVGAGLMLAAPVADGAFVGTFVAADATSLVVRAEDGQQETFVVDAATDLPPGFVIGTRILVRFEAIENGQYRATSVSPPHIPLEADVMTTLPAPPEGSPIVAAPLAVVGRALPPARAVPAAAPDRTPASHEGTALPSLVAAAPREPLAQPMREPLRDAPTPVPASARLAQGNAPHLASDWPLVLLAFLGSLALLGWGMLRYR